ncbi:MAG: response regulator [Pyrinomonadaceae bacterium]
MIEADALSAQTHVWRSEITTRINRALTPQEIACALADEAVAGFVPFDCCTLVLPTPEGKGIRIWRASRADEIGRVAVAVETSGDAYTLFARVLDEGASMLVGEIELECGSCEEFGREMKSAMALPLAAGGRVFGALCFASLSACAYSDEDTERLAWLADHVAMAAEAALLRARLDHVTDGLGEIERLKNGFNQTIVRDIRLPLTSVLGLLELFEGKLQAREPFDAEDRQLLNSAIEHGDRIRRLLDDYMEVSQQHERPLALEFKKISVGRLLEDVAEPLRGESALRGVELLVETVSTELALKTDERQTRRALSYLLSAALASTPDGGIVRVEAQAIKGLRIGDEGKTFVVISVNDSGEGIPAEEIPFVFDAFRQQAEHRGNGSQGVGLAIAKRIAAAHGGNVSVRSQLGAGTIYSILLPAYQEEAQESKPRILVVEDAPELLLLLKKLITRMGYEVETALSARAALEILRERQIDLLKTDWAMPEMNGGELIAHIKQDEKLCHIPTIVLTGHDTETEQRDARDVGCDRFLVKPVMRDELQRVILEMLREKVSA